VGDKSYLTPHPRIEVAIASMPNRPDNGRMKRNSLIRLLFIVLPALAGCFSSEILAAGTEAIRLAPDAKFGQSLDVRQLSPLALHKEDYTLPPLTVECWAKLFSKNQFNIILAHEPKASGTHWELYSYSGSGDFSVYMPGYSPSEVRSNREITDGQWHYLAWVFNGREVSLFVDAERVAHVAVRMNDTIERKPGPLNFGSLGGPSPTLGCDGLVDEVRLSKSARNISKLPGAPFEADEDTIGLWHMDKLNDVGLVPDASSLANHLRATDVLKISMDDLDRESYHAGPSPMSSEAETVPLSPGAASHPEGPVVLSLDGEWRMAEGGSQEQRLTGDWPGSFVADVPGSVHTALFEEELIPDPKFGCNDKIAHDKSFETYWFKRDFPRPKHATHERLVFDGVAIHCAVWLNGQLLGEHEGMFGGPEFDVSELLRENNTLIVRIDPAPGDRNLWNNPEWRTTVVFNNVWGWHYSSIPPLGIWRSVRLEGGPTVKLNHPFMATRNAQKGDMDLSVELSGPEAGWSGNLIGTVVPDNTEGEPLHFVKPVRSEHSAKNVHLRFAIPDPQLWWPNGLGEPSLYRLRISFVPGSRGVPDTRRLTFGIRTVEMAPLPGGPKSTQFNWTFVINKRPVFVKGAGWCTMDSSMDFSRKNYERFISLAALQHIQMFRGWGSGMPETDDFYDLCNRYGIMVFQEWPTAWDSHLVQPYDVLEETVRLNTFRIRNNPSLVLYGGGNESGNPFGKAIDMMGRAAIELDGTRVFHRGEPWGGSMHNYNCYWGRQPLDHNLNMTAPFFGEFGLACMPSYESVLRYLPEEERNAWPAPPDGSLVHHTPIFNTAEDWSRLAQYSAYFMPDDNLENFIIGSQLSQAVGVRHTLELARTRWPECTGALYYKMNDNYPAASWSCVDWYGAPKISHSFFQNSFAPLHACAVFKTVNAVKQAVSLPVWILDDADELKGKDWEVGVRAYDSGLKLIKNSSFVGSGSIDRVRNLGEFALSEEQTDTIPLLVVVEVKKAGKLADRTYYFINYEPVKGSLFNLPKTALAMEVQGLQVSVTNKGDLPGVGVHIDRPGHLDTFTADDNTFWLDPGETHVIHVNDSKGLALGAWNGKE
jgi:beta-mannosidase